MRVKPAQHRVDNLALILLVVLGQLQQYGDGQKIGYEQVNRLRPYPEHGRVVIAVAIGIFDGKLGFANAAQSANGLWLGDGNVVRVRPQGSSQPLQHLLPSSEEAVAPIGHIPYWQIWRI